MFITRQHASTTNVPARHGHRRRAAVPRCDDPRARQARRAGKAPVRMAFVYVPNGIDMRHWNPSYEGKLGELPQTLQPLEPLKNDILLLGNLTHNTGRALLDGAGDHGRCCGSYLTGVQVKKTVSDIKASVSCDQLVANQIGKQTRFPSLEVGLEDARQAGDCDSGYSCAYTNNLAWRSETQPLPPILDPRALFERLFGDGAELTPEARAQRRINRRSILDFITDDTRALHGSLGPTDQRKLDEYLSSIREIEEQLEARRAGERAGRSRHGEAVRRPERLRRALQADDRHDHGRVPGRPDARRHVPGDARGHVARLSRDRHPRRPSSAHAPPEHRRDDGQGRADQPLPRCEQFAEWVDEAEGRRRKATARCSTTR